METKRRDQRPDLFRTLDVDRREGERIAGPPVGFWKDSWIRLKKNRGAVISLGILILLFAFAFVIGPLLSQYSPYAQDLTRRYTGLRRASGSVPTSSGATCGRRVWEGRGSRSTSACWPPSWTCP